VELREGSSGGGRVAGLVLLAGGVRQSPFFSAIGRSPLDLPVAAGVTVLDLWERQADQLADALGVPELRCRLVVGSNSHVPRRRGHSRVTVETDPAQLRGTGGLLRDLSLAYEPDDYLIVGAAMQLPLGSFDQFVVDSMEQQVDVSILQDLSGTPPSLFVIACRALRMLPDRGFVDLKEQALPLISRTHRVQVVSRPERLGVPVRTAASYLSAIRAFARLAAGDGEETPFRERWRSEFEIAEPRAVVHRTARLHNAVVLEGATLGRQAVLADSIVCPGACVEDEQVVGKVVTSEGSFEI
jgi:hypothetical protein